jgi:hypothetical protein
MSTSTPAWFDPTYPPLSGGEAKKAVDTQMSTFPEVVRSNKDIPIPQQSYGLISMMLFKEPKKLKSGKFAYGFMKMRGNWSDVDQCKNKAASIIREQDSKNKIKISPVGEWLPITEDDAFVQENVDVNVDATEKDRVKEEAVKEQEIERARIQRELKERENEVKNSKDYNDDTDHIDYYTMKRVTWLRLRENIAMLKNQVQTLEGKLVDTRKVLANLDSKHPTYDVDWIDNYNKERRKSGIPDYIPGASEQKTYIETIPSRKSLLDD